MKSDVLASKGVLVSDPNIKKMNKARWIFEYEGYARKRKKFLRDLGLLLVGEKAQKLDIDEEMELLPLAYVLNPEVMNEYIKKTEEEEEGLNMNDEEYENMLKRYEESGYKLDDIELMEEENEQEKNK